MKSIYGSKLEIVFDIGCHKGETVDLLKKNFKIKKIYAFDVNTRIIEKLKEKNYLNVSFLNYGISGVSERKEFDFSKFSPVNSLKSNDKHSSFSKFKELLAVLSKPYEQLDIDEKYYKTPQIQAEPYKTFCGT